MGPCSRAIHAPRVGLEHDLDGAQLQRPPPAPPLTVVIRRRSASAAPAPATGPAAGPDVGDEQLLVLVELELDLFHDRRLDAQQGPPEACVLHAVLHGSVPVP